MLKKIFRLWGVYARMDMLLMTRDLKSIFGWIIADTVLNIAAVTGMFFLAERFQGIGIWSKFQIIFLLGYAALVDGLIGVFFSYNVAFISRRVGRGQLDHTIIQPQPLWVSLLTEGFSPAYGLPMLLPGIGLLIWAIPHLSLTLSFGWGVMSLLNMAASATVIMAFQFAWGSLAFWSPRSAEEINSSTIGLIGQLKSFPLDGLGSVMCGSLLTFLPVGFVAWMPCRALLGVSAPPLALWLTPGAAILFSLIAGAIFYKGWNHYGRVGSQRYSNFGHRG